MPLSATKTMPGCQLSTRQPNAIIKFWWRADGGHFYMFSENIDYVLLYRDHRTLAKAPTHNEKKAGQTVKVLRHLFQLYTWQQIGTVFREQIYLLKRCNSWL